MRARSHDDPHSRWPVLGDQELAQALQNAMK